MLDWFKSKQTTPTKTKSDDDFGINLLPKKTAGVKVDHNSAMTLDTVFACIIDKAESLGQLPALIKQGNRVIESGRTFDIFTQSPNDFQTIQDFIEMYSISLDTRGAFFAEVVRNKYGNVSQIIPFFNQWGVSVNNDRGRIYYTGATNSGKVIDDSVEILHIKQLTKNGYEGITPIQFNAQAIGISLAQEQHLGKVMSEGSLMRGYLSTDQIFKDSAILDGMKTAWRKLMRGEDEAGNTPILDQNLKFNNVTLSPADTELILQRKFSREQICGIYRVPPSRIGAAEKQTYNNVEQNNLSYFRDVLVPRIRRLELAMTKLVPGGSSFHLDEREFVRGDRESQVRSLKEELTVGGISLNEFRLGLGRDEIAGGDVHAIDTNNLTFGSLEDIPRLQQERQNQTVNNDE